MKSALLSLAVYIFLAAAVARGVDEPANVAGTWKMTFDTTDPRGPNTKMLTLKQKGNELDGTLKDKRSEIQVTGKIDGDRVHMSAHRILTVELDATVDKNNKNRMKGTVKALTIHRNWTAERQQ